MSKNKSDQNAHEEQVFNDVLRLSMATGGYKKKAALKVSGSINASSECPDIVITRENGSIVGLEHFRIDHNIKHGRNAQSKSAEFTSVMKAEREKLMLTMFRWRNWRASSQTMSRWQNTIKAVHVAMICRAL